MNDLNDDDTMTKELRAIKATNLANLPTCEWVEQTTAGVVLKWPYPLDKQYAVIDTVAGDVVKFVKQAGVRTQVIDPCDVLPKIDRRLSYLTDRYRVELRIGAMPEPVANDESLVF